MDDLVRDFPITNLWIPSFARGIKILLVDEDLSSLFNISSMLEEFSFKVTTVEQTSVALSMIQKQKNGFRLVIANVNMPDMNNLSFLHEIMKKIPVILMSSDSRIAERAICEGASFFIQKPVAPKNLKSVWQHADWSREEQNKKNYQITSEARGGNQRGSLGTKINETSTLSRPLMEGNIIKEASGTIRPHSGGIIIKEAGNTLWPSTNLLKPIESGFSSVPNTGCKYHGNLFTDPLSQRMQNEKIFFIIIDDENNSLQNAKASKKQEGSNLKRQLSDKQGKKQVKKRKTNLEIINSGGSAIKGKGQKEVGGDNKISIKKTWRSAWNPELHCKFTETINAVGDENVIPRTIEEEINAPGITRKQIASHQQKHEADRKRINETGTRSLPSMCQLPSRSHAITASKSQPPSCTHAITAFAPPLKKQNQLISQHGQGDLNFGVAGTTTQSINTKLPTQPEKYGAQLLRISEAGPGTTNLPSLSQPYCKHAITAFSSPLERQSSLNTEHGLQNFIFGVAGNVQSTIPEQECRPGVHRINETGRRSLPSISQSSCPHARTSFAPPLKRQSSLISQHGQGSVSFGDASNMQSTVQKPPTHPKAIVGSFISHGRRMPRQYTRKMGSSSNSKLNHKHTPNEVCLETHEVLQNQKRKTSSNGMTDKGKGKQPLGFKENRTQTARTNLPNVFFEISTPPSPYGSAGTQVSSSNLPNFSSEPPRVACPYVSSGTQAYEMNLNSSGASPRAPSLYAAADVTQMTEGSRTQTTRMNLPNVIFEISTPPSPYRSSGTQVSAFNLPNLSSAPQREASPYMSARNQVSEMNLPNSSGAPPRAPSLYVTDGTQVSEVNLPNSSYMPPSAAPSYVQVSTQGSEMNLPYPGFAPPRAPFANMAAGTQGSEMSLPNSNHVPSAYVATGTQLSETNVPNSSYASPEVPSPYVSTGIQVSGMSPANSSYVPPTAPSPSASASMFQLPNSAIYFQQNQDLASAYNLEYQNQLSMGATGTEVLNSVLSKMTLGTTGVSGKDEVLDSAPATITSSNATNPQELQTNFSHPIMNQAAAADSPNYYQFLSEYEDILRILDEDAANFEDFSYRPNLDEKSFQWLQKNMKGKNTNPF